MSTQHPKLPAPPTQASPGRRVLHSIIAAAGWLLFGYWWWLVLGRLDPGHVRFTVLFVLITLVVCVATTVAWAFHNLRIFRRRTPRDHVPVATYEFKRDRLGRNLFFADRDEVLARAQVVQIRLEHEGKVYRAFEKLAARPASRPESSPVTVTGTEATTTSAARVQVVPPDALPSSAPSPAAPPAMERPPASTVRPPAGGSTKPPGSGA